MTPTMKKEPAKKNGVWQRMNMLSVMMNMEFVRMSMVSVRMNTVFVRMNMEFVTKRRVSVRRRLQEQRWLVEVRLRMGRRRQGERKVNVMVGS